MIWTCEYIARKYGAKVALVERHQLAGIGTNDGCVPTRELTKAAYLTRDSEQLEKYGVVFEARPRVDF